MVVWQCNRFALDLRQPQVMGIVNLTPDSFSDGGQYDSPTAALRHAEQLIRHGAHILDLGAESTRPGAPAVPLNLELRRLTAVLTEVVRWGVPISVDTYKADVMRAALDLGADIINDVWALRQPAALQTVAKHPSCGVCLMHMHRSPQDMHLQPMQGSVLEPVMAFLRQRAVAACDQGIARERIALDPGIGFGKTPEQNFELLARQSELAELGHPVLVGWSRKKSLGLVTGLDVGERRVPSVIAALLAVQRGANIVRVHDVADTVAALAIARSAAPSAPH